MRRILAMIMAMLMMLSLCACGASEEAPAAAPADDAAPAASFRNQNMESTFQCTSVCCRRRFFRYAGGCGPFLGLQDNGYVCILPACPGFTRTYDYASHRPVLLGKTFECSGICRNDRYFCRLCNDRMVQWKQKNVLLHVR